jgi:hypothetical protein
MKREKIILADYATNAQWPDITNLSLDDWDTVRRIKKTQIDFDGEKGYADFEVVIQRISDDKYFKFTYSNFGCGENNLIEQTAYEVFPKTIQTVIYD